MRLKILYLISLNIFIISNTVCQSLGSYQPGTFFQDEDAFYTSGIKWVNASNKNKAEDGYNHSFDFYLAKYDLTGKKKWELIIDKKRDFNKASQIFKREDIFYTFFSVRNIKQEEEISFFSHYFIKFDSLGRIILEKKLSDSTFYSYNNILYTNDFIYVFLNKGGVVCEKYDYDFNLKEIIKNDLLNSTFYDSKIVKTQKNYVGIGPINNMDSVNWKIQNKTIAFYKPLPGYFIKKMDVELSKESKIVLCPLPVNEIILHTFFENNLLYLVSKEVNQKKKDKYKLYSYNEETNKVQLLIDTLSRGIRCFKAYESDEFLWITNGLVVSDKITKKLHYYPSSIYYSKKGKLISHIEVEDFGKGSTWNYFVIKGKRLFITETKFSNNTMKVRVYDF